MPVIRVHGREQISAPYLYTVDFSCDEADLNPEALLYTLYTVRLPLPDGSSRLISGLITRAERLDLGIVAAGHRLELRPWLWLLGFQRGCALFQNLSVPEIARKVCLEAGYSSIVLSLGKKYPLREYTVQFNESSLNFLQRLLAEEGIFYFFSHTESGPTLVLTDSVDDLPACEGGNVLNWYGNAWQESPSNQVRPLGLAYTAGPRACGVDDHNWLTPSVSLDAFSSMENPMFADFGSRHTTRQSGEDIASLRQDGFHAQRFTLRAETGCAALYPGGTTTIHGCPEEDCNGKWLVTEVETRLDEDGRVRTLFTAVPASVAYRPMPDCSRPRVMGPLTGQVCGKKGEEIWTDKYGRVKVLLHWDRIGKSDETASCWMRVVQPWAGAGYGAMFLPRVGEEVLVTFLDGDPDRPVVTGRIYNSANIPPWTLPAKGSVSGIKGRSTPDGEGDGNEISMDDKAGEERLYFHAQKLLECLVEDKRSTRILGEGGDVLVLEQGDLSVTIKKGKADWKVKGDYDLEVDGDFNLTVKGNVTVNGANKITCRSGQDSVVQTGGNLELNSGRTISAKADLAMEAASGTGLALDAGTSLSARAKTGLTASSSANAELRAGAILTLSGAMIKQN